MKDLFDALWRAATYCLHPKVIFLSLLPLLVAGALAFGLAWFFWEAAISGVRDTLQDWELLAPVLQWLDGVSAGAFRSVLGPLVVVALAVPMVLVLSLLLVALFMGPAMVNLVAERRFPALERRHGTPWWLAALWALGSTVVALLALAASVPLWLIPPMALLLPPLAWGWLAYRVMSVDALADHASADERRQVMREHRWPLLGIGLVAGYLGAAPSLAWAVFGIAALPMMPLLIPLFVWLYTLVFAFSALWFTHYALAALDARRARMPQAASRGLDPMALPATVGPPSLPSP
jgi:hypothetical protein